MEAIKNRKELWLGNHPQPPGLKPLAQVTKAPSKIPLFPLICRAFMVSDFRRLGSVYLE